MKRSEIYLKAIPIIEGGLRGEVIEGATETGLCIYTCWVLDALMFGKKKPLEPLRNNILDHFPEFAQQKPDTAQGSIWLKELSTEAAIKWRVSALQRAYEIAKSNGN